MTLDELNSEKSKTIEKVANKRKNKILQKFPQLARIPFVFAINYKIADESTISNANLAIHPSDEIALIPPISGG